MRPAGFPPGTRLRFHCEACSYTLVIDPGVDDITSGPVMCRTCIPPRIVEPPPRVFPDRKPDFARYRCPAESGARHDVHYWDEIDTCPRCRDTENVFWDVDRPLHS